MPTVEQTAGDQRQELQEVRDELLRQAVAELIDDLIGGLQAATRGYRRRSLDWDDVATLNEFREELSGAARHFSAAEASASLRRATRQVAAELRQLELTKVVGARSVRCCGEGSHRTTS
jgi:hypothetical protein